MRAVEGRIEPAYETQADLTPRWGSPSLVAGPLDGGEAPRFTREAPAVAAPAVALANTSRFRMDVPAEPQPGDLWRPPSSLKPTTITGAVLAILALVLLRRGPLVATGILGGTLLLGAIILRRQAKPVPRPVERGRDREGRFTRETPVVDSPNGAVQSGRFRRKSSERSSLSH
jgi:hypothetical protein